jgi:hypothetical protein
MTIDAITINPKETLATIDNRLEQKLQDSDRPRGQNTDHHRLESQEKKLEIGQGQF